MLPTINICIYSTFPVAHYELKPSGRAMQHMFCSENIQTLFESRCQLLNAPESYCSLSHESREMNSNGAFDG